MRQIQFYGIALGLLLTSLLAACGSGGSGSSSSGNTNAGVVYPVVAGLAYSTNSSNGVVAADGSYSYKTNENVTFSAGGIELNTVAAAANVTPLPLENDVASTNLLRLFKALDTDQDLGNGVTLPTLPASSSTVDLTSEASVAAALASLSPTATLPIAADAQVATALASTKTTALQNMGAYGTTYSTIIQATLGGGTPQAYYPKDATVSLTSQPNWSTGSMSGTATLTLNDNSQVTFTFNGATGTYTALGMAQTYRFEKDWGGRSRIIYLYYGDSTCGPTCGYLILRDNSQPNMPPVAGISYPDSTVSPALGPGGFDTYTWCTYWSGPGGVLLGSKDFDGLITSVTLASNKGKTVSMNLNVPTVGPACVSEIYYANETPGVTVTVTDDEGATSTKTYGSSSSGTTPVAGSAPTITGLSPTSGAVGTEVTITGTNFSSTPANNMVEFNGTPATVTAATTTSLTVTVPAGATTGTVSVTTAAGTGTSAGSFTVGAGSPTVSLLTLSAPYKPGGISTFNFSYPSAPSITNLYAVYLLDGTFYSDTSGNTYFTTLYSSGTDGISIDVTFHVDPTTGKQYFQVQGNEAPTYNISFSLPGADYSWGFGYSTNTNPACEIGSTCAGISVNRGTGEISFVNTPMITREFNSSNVTYTTLATFTLTGTLKIPPF